MRVYTFDDIADDSATVVISYNPHYKYIREQAEIVKNGSAIITITDSFVNPISEISDYSLIFNFERNNNMNLINVSPIICFFHIWINFYRRKKGRKYTVFFCAR